MNQFFSAERHFSYNDRLGIALPALEQDWEELAHEEQGLILLYWEEVRGRIPDRIFALEQRITELQQRLDHEHNFEIVCELAWEIADLASAIHDLQIYFRLNEDVAAKPHH